MDSKNARYVNLVLEEMDRLDAERLAVEKRIEDCPHPNLKASFEYGIWYVYCDVCHSWQAIDEEDIKQANRDRKNGKL